MKLTSTHFFYIPLAVITLIAAGTWAVQSQVKVSADSTYRYIEANGIPNHTTGSFPNRNNPNSISPQQERYRIPLNPQMTGHISSLGLNPFGVATNGVPFDPGAAEFWNNDRSSGWQYEALAGYVNLGLDQNNAHVQPTGAYHYHGLPVGLMAQNGDGHSALLGYAADGFPIYGLYGYNDSENSSSGVKELRSSYRVKSGSRPGGSSGPGGQYDGRFVQDYEYVKGTGDLDECNGRAAITPDYPNGTYYYVITTNFPFIPRCFKGSPDSSFKHAGMGGPPSGGGMMGGPGGRGGPPGMGGGFGGRRPPPPPGGFF